MSSQGSSFIKQIILIFSLIKTALLTWNIKFEKQKTLKTMLSDELIPIAWHPKRWWNFCVSEVKKKEIDRIFIYEF